MRWKPYCLPGAMGAKERTMFKAALQECCMSSAQHQGCANGTGTQHKMKKWSDLPLSHSVWQHRDSSERGTCPPGGSALRKPPAAEQDS